MVARARLWLRLLLLSFELRLALLGEHISREYLGGGVGGVDVHVGGGARWALPVALETVDSASIDTGMGTANEAEADPPQVM